MQKTISNRQRLTLLALLIGALLLVMSAVGLEDAQAATKVTLCHDAGQETQKTIKVSKKKAKKHLAHGDTRGKCTPLDSPAPAPAPPSYTQPPAYSGETGAKAWGNNFYGQLGNGTTSNTSSKTSVSVSNLSEVKDIAAGEWHSLALKTDGTVWAWGENSHGQLGNGTNYHRSAPEQVKNLSGVKAITAGYNHSLVLKEDGTVWAWGRNDNGQLGNGNAGSATSSNVPVQVFNMSGVKDIAGGYGHSLALKEDGTVWAWGWNYFGQLATGSSMNSYTPRYVRDLSGVKDIAAGERHSLALKEDGTVWAWGYNAAGQLGNGGNINRYTPVQAYNLSGVKEISAGEWHSLALKENGTVWAWGANYRGQVGDETTGNIRTRPVQASNLSGVKTIDAGAFFSLALKTDGTVQAWGANFEDGQLGDGTNTDRNTPVQVQNLSGVQDISGGVRHSLAKVSKPPVAQQ